MTKRQQSVAVGGIGDLTRLLDKKSPNGRKRDQKYIYIYQDVVVVVVVSHIQRIGCQPEKTTLHGGQSRSWSAEQEKKKKKSGSAPPPPPARCSFGEKKKKKNRK